MQIDVPQKSMSKLKASEYANLDNCYGKGNAVNCYAELDHHCEKENSALVSLSLNSAAQKSSSHPLSSAPVSPL